MDMTEDMQPGFHEFETPGECFATHMVTHEILVECPVRGPMSDQHIGLEWDQIPGLSEPFPFPEQIEGPI
jgi:hypothetical protein